MSEEGENSEKLYTAESNLRFRSVSVEDLSSVVTRALDWQLKSPGFTSLTPLRLILNFFFSSEEFFFGS